MKGMEVLQMQRLRRPLFFWTRVMNSGWREWELSL